MCSTAQTRRTLLDALPSVTDVSYRFPEGNALFDNVKVLTLMCAQDDYEENFRFELSVKTKLYLADVELNIDRRLPLQLVCESEQNVVTAHRGPHNLDIDYCESKLLNPPETPDEGDTDSDGNVLPHVNLRQRPTYRLRGGIEACELEEFEEFEWNILTMTKEKDNRPAFDVEEVDDFMDYFIEAFVTRDDRVTEDVWRHVLVNLDLPEKHVEKAISLINQHRER